MINEVTLLQRDDSRVITLPKAMTDGLGLSDGDKGYAVETDFGILLIPHDLELARVMDAEARISKQHSNALRQLAK